MYQDGYNLRHIYGGGVINEGNGASYYGSCHGDGGVPSRLYIGEDNNKNEIEEREHLSVTRLLSDDTQNINFYICQLHLMRGGG